MLASLPTASVEYRDTITLLKTTTPTNPADVESNVIDALKAIDKTIASGDPTVLAHWAVKTSHRIDARDVENLLLAGCVAVQKGYDRSDAPVIGRLLLSARHIVADALHSSDLEALPVSA